MTKEQARALLRERGLRATGPRVAVLRLLAGAEAPLSHTEVLGHLGTADWDPATIYRNLVKLSEAGLARVVSRAEGLARYALVTPGRDGEHRHPHFHCEACGRVACIPATLTLALRDERWGASLETAMVQLRGACPDCLPEATDRGC